MKTIKTSELSGVALDWAVAKCEGFPARDYCPHDKYYRDEDNKWFCPSEDWTQGGPIIDRETITVCWQGATWVGSKFNVRVTDEYEFHQTGPTPLLAAMRCYVASKLGDTVKLPEELLK